MKHGSTSPSPKSLIPAVMVAPGGFEPPFSDPKTDVLPLDEGAESENLTPALRPRSHHYRGFRYKSTRNRSAEERATSSRTTPSRKGTPAPTPDIGLRKAGCAVPNPAQRASAKIDERISGWPCATSNRPNQNAFPAIAPGAKPRTVFG